MRFLSRAVDSTTQLFLPNNFLRLEWIFCLFPGAASLMMLNSQRLVGQLIPTPGRAAMSVCRVIFPIVSGPSGAILIPLPIYGIVWLPKTSWCPVSLPVAFIALCKPNLSSRKSRPTLLVLPGNLLQTQIGLKRCVSAADLRPGYAALATTARV